MREIRFRAWLKEEKRYVFPTAILFSFGTVIGIEYNDTTSSGEVVNVRCIVDEFALEQDTDLKDKNGKEIWEGDIVAEHNGDVIGKIVQHPSGEWQIAWIEIFGGVSKLYDHRGWCEVIGNIHQNKELLERKNEE